MTVREAAALAGALVSWDRVCRRRYGCPSEAVRTYVRHGIDCSRSILRERAETAA